MSRARDNADLGDSYGVLGAGVTGGSGLDATSVARNYNVIITRPSTTTIDIDAGFLTLFDSSNHFVILGTGVASSACNLTLNQDNDSAGGGSNGVLGLDTGSFAVSTFYHLYVIYNGSAVSCVASLAHNWISTTNDGTAGDTKGVDKTNISGYTYGKYVGAVYVESGGTFEEFYQQDNVCLPVTKNIFAENTCDATHGCNISLVEVLPPTSYRMYLATDTWEVDGSGAHITQKTKSDIYTMPSKNNFGRITVGFEKREDDIGYIYDWHYVQVDLIDNTQIWVRTDAAYRFQGALRRYDYTNPNIV